MHYEQEENVKTFKKLWNDIEESVMSNDELDTIIRLIPKASPRQTEIIEGQIQIHKQITQTKEYKK